MIDFNTVQEEIYQINKANGWWEEDRDISELLALIHSELSEALEAYRDGIMDKHLPQYCGQVVELADTVIRILDVCKGVAPEFAVGDLVDHHFYATCYDRSPEFFMAYSLNLPFRDIKSFPTSINDIHDNLSIASGWADSYMEDKSKSALQEFVEALLDVMECCYVLARANGWDIHQALLDKLEINRARGYKHGGKKC